MCVEDDDDDDDDNSNKYSGLPERANTDVFSKILSEGWLVLSLGVYSSRVAVRL